MGLRELSHLSHGAVSVSTLIFLRAKRPFPLPSTSLLISPMADTARNIKFYFASPEHTRWRAEEEGGLETSLVAIGGRLEIKPCCEQLTKWVIDIGLLLECDGLRLEASLGCWGKCSSSFIASESRPLKLPLRNKHANSLLTTV